LDIAAYLKRINYRGTLEPTAETLRSLHRAHMLAVPLENLDYQLGRRIILNYADFAEMCRFQQTSPQSPYTQRRVCTMATPDGRVTLLNMQLKITVRGEHTVRLLESEEEYRVALYQYFGITLGELKFNTELILDTKSRLTHQ